MGHVYAGVVTQDHGPVRYRNSSDQQSGESHLMQLRITVRDLAMETPVIV